MQLRALSLHPSIVHSIFAVLVVDVMLALELFVRIGLGSRMDDVSSRSARAKCCRWIGGERHGALTALELN